MSPFQRQGAAFIFFWIGVLAFLVLFLEWFDTQKVNYIRWWFSQPSTDGIATFIAR